MKLCLPSVILKNIKVLESDDSLEIELEKGEYLRCIDR